MTVRCPGCNRAMLNTPRIQVQREVRKYVTLPFKVCMVCNMILPSAVARAGDWKYWDGSSACSLFREG